MILLNFKFTIDQNICLNQAHAGHRPFCTWFYRNCEKYPLPIHIHTHIHCPPPTHSNIIIFIMWLGSFDTEFQSWLRCWVYILVQKFKPKSSVVHPSINTMKFLYRKMIGATLHSPTHKNLYIFVISWALVVCLIYMP